VPDEPTHFTLLLYHLRLDIQRGAFPSNYLTKRMVQNNCREADVCLESQRNVHIKLPGARHCQ
jgi:hypothetical protein